MQRSVTEAEETKQKLEHTFAASLERSEPRPARHPDGLAEVGLRRRGRAQTGEENELAAQKISTSANDKRLEEARAQWEAIKKMVPDVKETVSPIQDLRGDEIKAKINAFTAKVAEYRAAFLKRAIFKYATGFAAAYPELDAAALEVTALEEELKDLTNLANMFEFPNMIKELSLIHI